MWYIVSKTMDQYTAKDRFTTYFNPSTKALLKRVAEHKGMKMNDLVEAYVSRELELESVGIEDELRELVTALATLRTRGSYESLTDEMVRQTAHTEAYNDEPLKVRGFRKGEGLGEIAQVFSAAAQG